MGRPLEDNVAVVMGAGAGYGRAVAIALGQAGAIVLAADRARDHHQLLVAARAELAVALVVGAADLAEDARQSFSRRHRNRVRSCGR